MNRNIYAISLIVLVSCNQETEMPAPGAPSPERRVILNVPLIKQKTDQWCWAACAEMVMTYHNRPASQCVQATRRFSLPNCCQTPTPNACIKPAWPDYRTFNFKYYTTRMGEALPWEALKWEIDHNRPVSFSWGWVGGGGHMLNAVGYIENGNAKFVAIHDPWSPSSVIIPYHEYVSSNRYTHWADYYEINPI